MRYDRPYPPRCRLRRDCPLCRCPRRFGRCLPSPRLRLARFSDHRFLILLLLLLRFPSFALGSSSYRETFLSFRTFRRRLLVRYIARGLAPFTIVQIPRSTTNTACYKNRVCVPLNKINVQLIVTCG